MKKRFDNKQYLPALQTLITCLLVLLLAFSVNFAFGKLPRSITSVDTTKIGLHTLSEATKEQIRAVEEDITIYLIAQAGAEDETTVDLLKKIEELSPHITVEVVDPAVQPSFLPQYVSEKTVQDNSLIVESARRYKFIDKDEYHNSTYYMGEDYLSSAVDYVTREELARIYNITGHDEEQIPEQLISTLSLDGYELIDLEAGHAFKIPEDATMVVLNDPKQDLSEEETKTVSLYLEAGGRLVLFTGANLPAETNILSILDNYGLAMRPGCVLEDDDQYRVNGMPAYILPQTNSNTETESLVKGVDNAILPMAYGLLEKDMHRDTVTVYGFLQSSDTSYLKDPREISADTVRSEGDESGPFIVGAAVTEQNGDTFTKVLVVSDAIFLDADVNDASGGANYNLFLNSVDWMDDENVSTLNTKLIATQNLTIMTNEKRIGGFLLLGVIPFSFLVIGILVWMRRRSR